MKRTLCQYDKKIKFRTLFVVVVFSLSFGLVVGKSFYLQVFKHRALVNLGERQYGKSILIHGERGEIVDRHGNQLACSVQAESLYAIPYEIEDRHRLSWQLAKILGGSVGSYIRKFNSHPSFVWIKRRLPPSKVLAIQALQEPGLKFLKESKRFYPNGYMAGQLIGFVGLDDKGLEGVEYYYDELLKSQDRLLFPIRSYDFLQKLVERKLFACPTKGCSITLTIDRNIQYIIEKRLYETCRKYRAKSGCIIVMDPQSGEILGMSNYAPFNPNDFKSYSSENWRNKTITDCFEPGSTFKPFVVAAALEHGLVYQDDLFFCENGAFRVGSRIMHDHKRFGWLTLPQILEKSSNIGAVKVGMLLGKDKLYQYIRAFGFGEKTGLGLPGEVGGVLRPPRKWSGTSIGAISIGQEIGVTPIQLITAFSCFANGGNLLKPFIVKRIADGEGRVIKENVPTLVKRVVSANTARMVKQMLRSVVENGTGKKAKVSGYDIAGKTGTAQKQDPVLHAYSKDKYLASFAGFLPVSSPKLVLLVMIDEPIEDCWGGVVAAPLFGEVIKDICMCKSVIPENNRGVFFSETCGEDKESDGVFKNVSGYECGSAPMALEVSHTKDSCRHIMPNVLGKSVREVVKILSKRDVHILVEGVGVAVYQSPFPGTKIHAGSKCIVGFRYPHKEF